MFDNPFLTGEQPGRDEVKPAHELPRAATQRRHVGRKVQAQGQAINAEWRQIMFERWQAEQERKEQELQAAEIIDALGLDARQIDNDPQLSARARARSQGLKEAQFEPMTWEQIGRVYRF